MSIPRIVEMTSSCGECPRYSRVSGSQYECALVRQPITHRERVAPFCPLPVFPAQQIAEMEVTMLGLQKAVDYSFVFSLMTFVAAKFRRRLQTSGSAITIPLRDGKSVTLFCPYISKIELSPLQIHFTHDEKRYVLYVEGRDGPRLDEIVRREGIEEDLYHQVEIAV